MAFGRVRNNKRSSYNSYASTITTIIFIAVCVLGVWLLTSDNGVPPQSTTRTSTTPLESDDITKSDGSNVATKQDDETSTDDNSDDPKKSSEDQKLDQATSKDYSQEANMQEKERQSDGDVNGNGKGKENESQVDENEKPNENQTQVSEEQDKDNSTDKSTNLDAQRKDRENDQSEESQNDGSNKDEKQKDENQQQQTTEEQPREQQQEDQQQDQKSVTFSDETKKDQTTQQEDIKEEVNTRLEKDDNNQQDKLVSQQQDKEVMTKPVESQQEKDQTTQPQDIREETNTKAEKDDTNQQDKPMFEQQDKEGTIEQVDSQQKSDSITQVNKQEKVQTTQPQDIKEEKSTRVEKDDTNRQDKESTTRESDSTSEGNKHDALATGDKPMESNLLPNSGIPKESNESKNSWSTQAAESRSEKQRNKDKIQGQGEESLYGYTWKLCNVTTGPDYIPCLDNEKVVKQLRSIKHFEHRERHCPEDPPTCLVPFPLGYKKPIQWPQSRDKIWFNNVPHTELAKVKGHQNWVKVSGEFLTFPGGGTQFIHGALHYIDFLEKIAPEIKWGKHTKVVLDVGCGVASFGGYLFEKDVLTMSFAPKDEHEAQVQFALERGIPAISAVMGSQRLPFPSAVFDIVHCARCRVPWHAEGGRLLLELNRVLRPGGYFVWSATPVYQKLQQDVEIWEAMSKITASICWKLEKKEMDALNKVGAAIFRKPINNNCYDQRQENEPPMCKNDDDPNAAWYVPIQPCMHRVPTDETTRGSKWPLEWPKRLHTPPYWLNKSQVGVYGRVAPNDFVRDYKHWHYVVNKSYLSGVGISWSNVRNVMDMRAVYGGFAAALRDLQIWVLNVVNVNSPDTLPIIYERGLFGIYHDWCESFSTYPRTYDLLHADHLFSKLKERCKLAPVMAEIDRIVRPGGKLIVRDESSAIGEIENLLKSLHWEVHMTFSKDQEGILSATKTEWRPQLYTDS